MLRDFLQRNNFMLDGGIIDKARRIFHEQSVEEMFFNIGDEKDLLDDNLLAALRNKGTSKGWRRFVPFIGKSDEKDEVQVENTALDPDWVKKLNRKEVLVLNEEVLRKCVFSTCCQPIPGDDVLGYITDDGELHLHKRNCETAVKLKTRYGNNLIACRWDTHKVTLHDVKIQLRGIDSQNVLYSIAEVLHTLTHFNVKRIQLDTDDGIFEGYMIISVYDTADVVTVCDKLRALENVEEAVRV